MKKLMKTILIECSKNIILHNVNKTHFKKNSLLIYITKPFVKKWGSVSHPNYYKAKIISKCLEACGYNVDVIYSQFTRNINLSRYDLIIGMGEGYTNTFGRTRENCKRIYYATGTCFTVANQKELERWIALCQKGKGFIGVERLEKIKEPLKALNSLYNSDAIISGGDNEWVMSSYTWTNKKMYSIGNFPLTNYSYKDMNRNICNVRYNVLFLGGNGCIHKGLDIIVDVFCKRDDYTLYIVGNIEEEFKNMYKSEIEQGNIILEGFMDVKTEAFKSVCNQCGFIIHMSCSESCCTSVLTGMATGLIPIITEAEGINIDDSGYLLEQADCNEIDCVLDVVKTIPEKELLYKMEKASKIVKENYSQNSFYIKFMSALKDILKEEI